MIISYHADSWLGICVTEEIEISWWIDIHPTHPPPTSYPPGCKGAVTERSGIKWQWSRLVTSSVKQAALGFSLPSLLGGFVPVHMLMLLGFVSFSKTLLQSALAAGAHPGPERCLCWNEHNSNHPGDPQLCLVSPFCAWEAGSWIVGSVIRFLEFLSVLGCWRFFSEDQILMILCHTILCYSVCHTIDDNLW